MGLKKRYLVFLVSIIASLIFYTQITIFVIQPIGAIPDGKTLIILRTDKTEFIDSPDAICERIQGGVSLLCRLMVLGTIANKSEILYKLPYSELLYSISTKGKAYER